MKWLLLLLVVFTVGCTTEANNGLQISMQADPPVVFENGKTTIHVDVRNEDIKILDRVVLDIFNYGLMIPVDERTCFSQLHKERTLFRDQFETFSCDFIAPEISQDRMQTQLDARVSYITRFSAAQQLDLISEQEYNNRRATQTLTSKPQRYTHSDRNVQLDIEFSDTLPIVTAPGRQYFVTFTIKNIGEGFIGSIPADAVRIIQKGTIGDQTVEGNLLQSVNPQGVYEPCRVYQTLVPIGKDFTTFSCQVLMPSQPKEIMTANFIVQIDYIYELRDSVTVDIIR